MEQKYLNTVQTVLNSVFNFPLESASIKKDDSTDSEYEQEKYLLSLPSVNFEIPGDVSIASMTGANPTYSYTGTLAGMTESENVELKLDLQRLEAGKILRTWL